MLTYFIVLHFAAGAWTAWEKYKLFVGNLDTYMKTIQDACIDKFGSPLSESQERWCIILGVLFASTCTTLLGYISAIVFIMRKED